MSGRPADRAVSKEVLALYGGEPVRKTLLPYARHSMEEEDIAAVEEVLRSDWITQGPKVEEFERALADYCEAEHGVAFSSGTAALHAACAAAGLSAGDEAITTPLTFAATANAVVYCGATPVFADVQGDTLNIDPEQIRKLVNPATKAILPVDFAGQPADLDPILALAKEHNLVVIEDACHALGAQYKGKKIGSVAHMTVFSFHPAKHVATGEGGMVLTDNPTLAGRLRRLRHHGIHYPDSARPWRYEILELGYNYRLSDIHCALGMKQLARLEAQLKRRGRIAEQYKEAFSRLEAVSLPQMILGAKHAWHLFVILLNLELLTVDRDLVLEALRAENIGATVHYPLVHLHPYYRDRFGYTPDACPIAEAIAPRLLTLPLLPAMTDRDMDDVITGVNKVLDYFS